MSLKDIAKKAEGQFKKEENIDDIEDYEKILSLSFIESMNQFLYGMYVAHQKLKGFEVLDAEKFINEMKSIPKLEDEKEKKKFLNNNSKIGKFLIWYLYDS